MVEALGYISDFLLFVTTIIALVYRKKFGKLPLVVVPYLLLFLSISKLLLYSFSEPLAKGSIYWHMISHNIEVLVYLYVFYNLSGTFKFKRALSIIFIVLFVLSAMSQFIDNFYINTFDIYFITISYGIAFITVFWYLIEFFKSDEVLYFYKYLSIWIGIGVLLYLAVSIPVLVSGFYLRDSNFHDIGLPLVLRGLKKIMKIIMFILFSIGVLWTSKPSR